MLFANLPLNNSHFLLKRGTAMTLACSRRNRRYDLPTDLDSFLELTEPEPLPHGGSGRTPAADTAAAFGCQVRTLADVTPLSTGWLCPGLLPRGRLTVLAGESGTGKSYLAADLAARLSTFHHHPGKEAKRPASGGCEAIEQPYKVPSPGEDERPARVLWAACDDPADLLHARLSVLGADLTRITAVTPPMDGSFVVEAAGDAIFAGAIGGSSASAGLLPVAPAVLREVLGQSPQADLLVIDGLRVDPLDRAAQHELAAVLAELADLAATSDVAVLLIWQSEAGRRGRRAIAALAEPACVAALWQLDRHPADPGLRRLAAVKWNLADDPRPLGFRLPDGRLEWQFLPSDPRLATGSERQMAAAWLRDRLADGPVPVRDLQAEARDCGFSMRTLRRAREDLGLEAVHQPDGGTAGWHWELPEQVILASPFPSIWEPQADEEDGLGIGAPVFFPTGEMEASVEQARAGERTVGPDETAGDGRPKIGEEHVAAHEKVESPEQSQTANPAQGGEARQTARKRRAKRLLTNWAK
jgi:putative DNA primase/helicase